ncbi:FecCD family ABC transporter permease [Ferdinandcohnia quinoae]|uniref:Iron ABC transporter permease n=1 Tax=Fredinandcohnia quinoae TaxID=2918902 RepID=A0AAW5E2X6_9BACI|nr:iron ABC transporter permease [Fredinandcohnia sp. SECRCQ15]MCH1625904.1 iron ABC transporter permease [Fredinandcohnia sp. SECRCQ15]
MQSLEVTNKKTQTILQRKRALLFICCLLLAIASIIYGLATGSVTLSLTEIWNGLTEKNDSLEYQIIWNIRLPRILTGLLVGMCLAVSGGLLQGIMRNPLADPGIIGISSGAGLVAIVTMLIFPQYTSLLPFGAFLGAFIAAAAVYMIAWDGGVSPLRLILAGVAINTLLGAITSAVMILHSDKVQAVLPWLMGGLSERSWPHFWMIFPYAVVGLILSLFATRTANILRLGDDAAKLLGHNVEKSRFLLILLSTFLAGAAVSVAGLLGFVGLVVPHIIRLMIGDDYKYLIPISALFGGLLVAFADTAARSWFDPIELPVGILLATAGGPFFLYLLRKGKVMGSK